MSSILHALALGVLIQSVPSVGWAEPAAAVEAITESGIRAHMEFLAGDALNGRGSGTRDEWLAAAYLGSQARRIGLLPLQDGGDYVQSVDIQRTEVTAPPVLTAGGTRYTHGNHIMISRLAHASESGLLVRYRTGTPLPRGAVALMPRDAPRGVPPQAGEAALLLYAATPAVREHWADLAMRPLTVGTPRLVGIEASGAAATAQVSQAWVDADTYARLENEVGKTSVSLTAEAHEVVGHTWNALARLPGSDPSRPVLLLSAHLDHLGARDNGTDRIFNGADDDASGCVAVLALAEALKRGASLRRTVVFAWFGSEEAGGYGARYFVQKPVVPLERIAANVEFEMIGRADPAIDAHSLWLTGWERSDLGPNLARHGARLVADPHPQENFFVRSDNIALARRGVVAQTVSSFGLHADYHQPSDDLAHIDFAHMVESIRSLLEPMRWLADSDFTPHWNAGQQP